MTETIRSHSYFLTEAITQFRIVGAVTRSSSVLANAICLPVSPENTSARRILEVGGGNGAITEVIVEKLQSGDKLVVVEINDSFYSSLKKKLQFDNKWRKKTSQIKLQHGDVLDQTFDAPFDTIICSLPFYNFRPDQAKRIIDFLFDQLSLNGTFSCYHYFMLPELAQILSSGLKRKRSSAIKKVFNSYQGQLIKSELVAINLPPATISHYRKV